jgi:hypothetical protein
MSSAPNLQNVSENFGVEILNNFHSVKNMLKEYRPLNFISIQFKELLAQKR